MGPYTRRDFLKGTTAGAHAIPTLLVFKDGREVRRLVGAQKGEDLRALLEWYVTHP